MTNQNLANQAIEDLAPQIESGTLSPVDLVDGLMERIAAYDNDIKSFVCLAEDVRHQAEAVAKEIKQGGYKGPLHGIPIAVKDNYATFDMPTLAGTEKQIDGLTGDARAVAKLREAGAIMIGKTNMHQFAWGNESPPTRNPWDLNRVPGGSSGGSGAAIAAGLCSSCSRIGYRRLHSDTG